MESRNHHREKLFFLMFAGATGIILLVIGGYQLVEFMDSDAFCGRLELALSAFSMHVDRLSDNDDVGPWVEHQANIGALWRRGQIELVR